MQHFEPVAPLYSCRTIEGSMIEAMKQDPKITQGIVSMGEGDFITEHPESTTVSMRIMSIQIFGCYILTLHAE